MKIAFIQPNCHMEYPRPPLGLLSVATVCKVAGHEVKIIDANLHNLSPKQVATYASDCDVVGITAMTPSINEAIEIADSLSDKIVILGGVHASCFPEWCRDTGAFDAVVVGEGENEILTILSDIEMTGWKLTGMIYNSYTPVDLNAIPLPDYSLLEVNEYKALPPHRERLPWTIASTSRGCIYSCTFCVHSVHGRRTKEEWSKYAMTGQRMFELVKQLRDKQGIRDITFYDDLFTLDSVRLIQFFRLLEGSGIDLSWTCESRVNYAIPSTLNWMHSVGCRLIYYGIESGSQTILNKLNKGQTLDQIRRAVKNTQEAGIKAAGYFMIGCPNETKEMIGETIDFAHKLNLDHAQFSLCSPLPGSKLFDDYSNMGYPMPDWSEFRYLGGNGNKPLFTTKELTREYLEQKVIEANAGFAKLKI